MKRLDVAVFMVVAFVAVSCGGGGGSGDDAGEEAFGGVGQTSGDDVETDQASSGSVDVGPVTQTADPGTGWVEVEGERYEFTAFGSTHFQCDLLEDQIVINFQQTTSGSDFILQGGMLNGQWNANLTFSPGEENQIQYGANLSVGPGTVGIDDQAFSYEGTLSRVEDYDIQNAQDVDGVIAVNCASPGGDATAEIGGETFTFPLSGAGSLDCVVSDGLVQVLISHSQPEYLQLQVDIQDQGEEWFGAVYVTAVEDAYTSYVPPDGTGLEIEGSGLAYAGVFETPDGGEVDGTVTLSCG